MQPHRRSTLTTNGCNFYLWPASCCPIATLSGTYKVQLVCFDAKHLLRTILQQSGTQHSLVSGLRGVWYSRLDNISVNFGGPGTVIDCHRKTRTWAASKLSNSIVSFRHLSSHVCGFKHCVDPYRCNLIDSLSAHVPSSNDNSG